jgi:hypothetical protein
MTPKTDNKAIDFISTADEQRRNTAEPLVPALTNTFIVSLADPISHNTRAGLARQGNGSASISASPDER